MNPFMEGFADELTKHAGAKKSLAKGTVKTLIKHPLATLGLLGTAAATLFAGRAGYRTGKAMGGRPVGHLAVTRQMQRTGGPPRPTMASKVNWHRLFRDHPMHKNIDRRAFQRRNIHYRKRAYG